MAKKGFVFSKERVKEYYRLKEGMPKFKQIVAQEVSKKKGATAQKIIESTSIKPITVYKSLQSLNKEKRIKVTEKERVKTTPPKQEDIFIIKHYAPRKG
jgi:hypothetical protein